MSEPTLKVTDKRMFTPAGELREEYRHLGAEAPRGDPPPAPAGEPPIAPRAAGDAPPAATPGPGEPTFYDLLATLVEPAAVYLGEARLPDGRSAEDLDLARLYIDLLDVLRRKTAGNLDARESAALDDALYQLRLRHVQKRG